jgi:hypothetical protein
MERNYFELARTVTEGLCMRFILEHGVIAWLEFETICDLYWNME